MTNKTTDLQRYVDSVMHISYTKAFRTIMLIFISCFTLTYIINPTVKVSLLAVALLICAIPCAIVFGLGRLMNGMRSKIVYKNLQQAILEKHANPTKVIVTARSTLQTMNFALNGANARIAILSSAEKQRVLCKGPSESFDGYLYQAKSVFLLAPREDAIVIPAALLPSIMQSLPMTAQKAI